MARSDTFKVGLVSAACIFIIVLVSGQILHVAPDLAVLGPIILFCAYMLSDGWTPVPEWKPSVYWSVSIVIASLVELLIAYLH